MKDDLISRQAAIKAICEDGTMFEQDKNRRNSVLVEWNGETHNITEWANITGIKRSTINNRYWKGDRGEVLFREAESYGGRTWIINEGKRQWVDA